MNQLDTHYKTSKGNSTFVPTTAQSSNHLDFIQPSDKKRKKESRDSSDEDEDDADDGPDQVESVRPRRNISGKPFKRIFQVTAN